MVQAEITTMAAVTPPLFPPANLADRVTPAEWQECCRRLTERLESYDAFRGDAWSQRIWVCNAVEAIAAELRRVTPWKVVR